MHAHVSTTYAPMGVGVWGDAVGDPTECEDGVAGAKTGSGETGATPDVIGVDGAK